jgi:hypothetical protein
MLESIKRMLGIDTDSIPLTREQKREVDKLLNELVLIGTHEDYLSERPGGAFDNQCRHRRSRDIGTKLDQMGGYPLMWKAFKIVQKKAGKTLASHLEYAWVDVGRWMA